MNRSPSPPRASRLRARLAAAGPLLALLSVLVHPPAAQGGEWRVAPIRLDLGREAKTGVVTVINDADEKLQVQMTASEWTQDGEGKDRYAESGDLVFFPKIMVLGGREERILRAGIRVPAVKEEKAYRLFIEEIPGPKKSEGASVAIAVRFGLPVFVKPLKEEPGGEIGPLTMEKGTVSARVRNTGNVHFAIGAVIVTGRNGRGEAVVSKEIGGWYLLAGASRLYATAIPQDVCPGVDTVDVEVKTDRVTLTRRLNADRSMCTP